MVQILRTPSYTCNLLQLLLHNNFEDVEVPVQVQNCIIRLNVLCLRDSLVSRCTIPSFQKVFLQSNPKSQCPTIRDAF